MPKAHFDKAKNLSFLWGKWDRAV